MGTTTADQTSICSAPPQSSAMLPRSSESRSAREVSTAIVMEPPVALAELPVKSEAFTSSRAVLPVT